jgi:magnesium transporter
MTNRMVDCYEYADGRRIRALSLDEVDCRRASESPDRFVWIRLHEPDEECLEQVRRKVGLHELAVEDAHHAHQRPKLERYDDMLFLVVRTVERHAERTRLTFGEAHAFLGPGYLVTVRHGPHYHDVVIPRVEERPDLLRYGNGSALYALLDFIADTYVPVGTDLENELDEIEDSVFANQRIERRTTARIYELKRDLLTAKRAVAPLVGITKHFSESTTASVAEELRPYFRDTHDHVVRMDETLDRLSELHAGILEANLSLTSLRQNEVMKKLAGWAAILAVPTMIGGIFGMNFTRMPGLEAPWGFAATITVMISLAAVLYAGLRRADWL